MSINNFDFSLDNQSSFGFPSFFKKGKDGDDIYNILVKSSEEELKQKLGFWAVPLPKKGDIQDRNTNLTYVRKK